MQRFFTQRLVALFLTAVLFLFLLFFHTPRSFVPETLVSIPPGSSFGDAAAALKDNNVITSTVLLRISSMFTGGASSIHAGNYFFEAPPPLFSVARRLGRGDYRLRTIRVLLPEGSSTRDMGVLLEAKLPHINAEEFRRTASSQEGYLFPDTYFLLPTVTTSEVIQILADTFVEKTKDLEAETTTSGHSWSDIVIMASLLEEEAQTYADKQVVSGILWKRIREGVRLQVDAPFVYLFDKASDEVTEDDLAADSPYNTYTHDGLPIGPITNPGRASLEAALRPTESSYWYYLSDGDGVLHFAETFEEHIANKRLYIE